MDEKKFIWIKKVVIDRPSPIRFWEVDRHSLYIAYICMYAMPVLVSKENPPPPLPTPINEVMLKPMIKNIQSIDDI